MVSLTDQAVALAEAGWPVFPVDAASKRPRTAHGHLDATNQTGQVRLWTPLFNQGGAIATPTGNGLLVVDIDPRNGGSVPSWAPRTRTVRTQSGGLHLHYAIDEDIKSRASLFGQGVDSKCSGGYVLIPPSPGYEWLYNVPRVPVTKAWVLRHVKEEQLHGASHSAKRLPPDEWRRGIIHDQVVAWAAYFAQTHDDEADVVNGVWSMVQQARDAGVRVDNARNHIGTAITWVLERERSKGASSFV